MKKAAYILGMLLTLGSSTAKGEIKHETWGSTPSGEPVQLYTLKNKELSVQLTDYGARLVSVEAPGRDGHRADVVLGYPSLGQYISDTKTYFGSTVGRYGNRIAKGTFSLVGETYQVPANNLGNALHGGPQGFDRKVWRGRAVGDHRIEFTLVSPDGDMGFPGTLSVQLTYTLEGNRLRIEYRATTTKPTVLNLTNHSYFNLAGEGSGSVLGQELRIDAESFTPVDETLITTGAIDNVTDTPFDFRTLKPIGKEIDAGGDQLERAGGYDHNFVVIGKSGVLREAAYALDPVSGRSLTVLTTEPGVQFYSGNFLDGTTTGPSGTPYQKHAGFCLETQHFPDSPNHPDFPSTVLKPGNQFRSQTVLVFGVQQQQK